MDDIARRIESAYGSLAEPRFDSVAAALDARPYDALMAEVARVFVVEEDTDPDDDHGFVYGLDRAGLRWVLMLSVVGPYAAFARLSDAWDDVLTPASPDLRDEERWLLDVLSRAGLRALTRAELEDPIDLRLFSVGPGEVRVFHALFTDSPGLPWDRETLRRLGIL
ncbi:hypothetical protein [Actinomadura atramentaria]|uniref:hypothetical protein n=1 Tax=Actinomadura atramentaria TaxID=1990 RepID=UPI0003748C40|nr:hypothetical protein [Actinomadura atramentaria]